MAAFPSLTCMGVAVSVSAYGSRSGTILLDCAFDQGDLTAAEDATTVSTVSAMLPATSGRVFLNNNFSEDK